MTKQRSRFGWATSRVGSTTSYDYWYQTPVVLTGAYLRHSRHGTCHGSHFDGGAKLHGKNQNLYWQFLEPLFCAPYIHKLQSCINTRQRPSLPNALSRACCASTTKHYDKTVALWHNTRVTRCDRTRTLACHIYMASSLSRYKKG